MGPSGFLGNQGNVRRQPELAFQPILSSPSHLPIEQPTINRVKTRVTGKAGHHGAQLRALSMAEPQQVTSAMNLFVGKVDPMQVIMTIRAHATENPETDIANLQPPNIVLVHA